MSFDSSREPRARGRGDKRIDRDTPARSLELGPFPDPEGRQAWPKDHTSAGIARTSHRSSKTPARSSRDLIASFLSGLRRLQPTTGRQKQRRLLNIAQLPSGKAPDFDSGIRWFESNLGSHTTGLRISGASIRLRRNVYDENRVL